MQSSSSKGCAQHDLEHPISPPRDVTKRHPETGHGQYKDDSLEDGISNFAVISASDACLEIIGTVGKGKRLVGHLLAEEFAERLPALGDVVLEKLVFGHELAHKFVVRAEHIFASVLKVALEQPVPQQEEHGPVEGKGPVKV